MQNKVMEELEAIFGPEDNGKRPITESDCRRMTYLESCIKETLRLMPPVSFITRKIGCDIHLGKCSSIHFRFHDLDKLLKIKQLRSLCNFFELEDNGGRIPIGTEVAISTYAVHRNPDVYPDPNTFKPERFLQEVEPRVKIGAYDWIPFSSGARNCLGKIKMSFTNRKDTKNRIYSSDPVQFKLFYI